MQRQAAQDELERLLREHNDLEDDLENAIPNAGPEGQGRLNSILDKVLPLEISVQGKTATVTLRRPATTEQGWTTRIDVTLPEPGNSIINMAVNGGGVVAPGGTAGPTITVAAKALGTATINIKLTKTDGQSLIIVNRSITVVVD